MSSLLQNIDRYILLIRKWLISADSTVFIVRVKCIIKLSTRKYMTLGNKSMIKDIGKIKYQNIIKSKTMKILAGQN